MEKLFVLLAEDDSYLKSTLVRILDRHGVEVLAVADGRAAIQELEAGSARFALVLTDFNMPKANGEDVLLAAKRCDPGLPVVVMSGTFDSLVQERLKKEGASATVLKESTMNEFLRVIDEFCRK